ncbi:hypothetical protein Pfo_031548, partial [Paulownia fortunei]
MRIAVTEYAPVLAYRPSREPGRSRCTLTCNRQQRGERPEHRCDRGHERPRRRCQGAARGGDLGQESLAHPGRLREVLREAADEQADETAQSEVEPEQLRPDGHGPAPAGGGPEPAVRADVQFDDRCPSRPSSWTSSATCRRNASSVEVRTAAMRCVQASSIAVTLAVSWSTRPASRTISVFGGRPFNPEDRRTDEPCEVDVDAADARSTVTTPSVSGSRVIGRSRSEVGSLQGHAAAHGPDAERAPSNSAPISALTAFASSPPGPASWATAPSSVRTVLSTELVSDETSGLSIRRSSRRSRSRASSPAATRRQRPSRNGSRRGPRRRGEHAGRTVGASAPAPAAVGPAVPHTSSSSRSQPSSCAEDPTAPTSSPTRPRRSAGRRPPARACPRSSVAGSGSASVGVVSVTSTPPESLTRPEAATDLPVATGRRDLVDRSGRSSGQSGAEAGQVEGLPYAAVVSVRVISGAVAGLTESALRAGLRHVEPAQVRDRPEVLPRHAPGEEPARGVRRVADVLARTRTTRSPEHRHRAPTPSPATSRSTGRVGDRHRCGRPDHRHDPDQHRRHDHGAACRAPPGGDGHGGAVAGGGSCADHRAHPSLDAAVRHTRTTTPASTSAAATNSGATKAAPVEPARWTTPSATPVAPRPRRPRSRSPRAPRSLGVPMSPSSAEAPAVSATASSTSSQVAPSPSGSETGTRRSSPGPLARRHGDPEAVRVLGERSVPTELHLRRDQPWVGRHWCAPASGPVDRAAARVRAAGTAMPRARDRRYSGLGNDVPPRCDGAPPAGEPEDGADDAPAAVTPARAPAVRLMLALRCRRPERSRRAGQNDHTTSRPTVATASPRATGVEDHCSTCPSRGALAT